ncbi:MAG: LuxR C-terminal-related transcriptional regulator [Opitutaceae bacterium]
MDASAQPPISIALLDTHRILRDGLECLIAATEGLAVVGSVATVEDLSACMEVGHVDVVVMGLLLDGADGLNCLAELSVAHPATKFLALSQLPEGIYAQRVLQVGGSGYMMKNVTAAVLLAGIRRAAEGEIVVSEAIAGYLLHNLSKKNPKPEGDAWSRITDREILVLNLMGQGHTTAAIANQMGISPKTVSTYKERIKVKMSLENSLQLTQIALQSLGRSEV